VSTETLTPFEMWSSNYGVRVSRDTDSRVAAAATRTLRDRGPELGRSRKDAQWSTLSPREERLGHMNWVHDFLGNDVQPTATGVDEIGDPGQRFSWVALEQVHGRGPVRSGRPEGMRGRRSMMSLTGASAASCCPPLRDLAAVPIKRGIQ